MHFSPSVAPQKIPSPDRNVSVCCCAPQYLVHRYAVEKQTASSFPRNSEIRHSLSAAGALTGLTDFVVAFIHRLG